MSDPGIEAQLWYLVALFAAEAKRAIQEGNVRVRLREIAYLLFLVKIVLLRQQSHVVSQFQESLK